MASLLLVKTRIEGPSHARRHRDSPLPGGRRTHRERSLDTVCRTGRYRQQSAHRGRSEPIAEQLSDRLVESRWRWPAIYLQQYAGRSKPCRLLECLSGIEGRRSCQPRQVPHACRVAKPGRPPTLDGLPTSCNSMSTPVGTFAIAAPPIPTSAQLSRRRITLNGVTAIPRTDADFDGPPFQNATSIPGNVHIQAIANVAAFHFGISSKAAPVSMQR